MENVSLSALFLLEACKLADSIFGVTHSSHHTIADATTDINKMVDHLRKSSVSTEKKDRAVPSFSFSEPLSRGMDRIAQGWLSDFLLRTETEDTSDTTELENDTEELDINYELHDSMF